MRLLIFIAVIYFVCSFIACFVCVTAELEKAMKLQYPHSPFVASFMFMKGSLNDKTRQRRAARWLIFFPVLFVYIVLLSIFFPILAGIYRICPYVVTLFHMAFPKVSNRGEIKRGVYR
jgi:hypothetical protein